MGRFLDERGRILGKVNVVDVIVVLVLLAVVVFAVVRTAGGASSPVPVRVTFVVEAVRQPTVDAIQAKGTVRDDGGTVLGEVQEVSVSPTKEEFMTPEGELKAFDSPVFSDVRIVVSGKGTLSGATVRVGNVPMRVGKKVTLVGPGYEVQTTIMTVHWGEEAH